MTVPHVPLSHPKYRPDIDGLRAIAVVSVVAFHAFPSWIGGGFIGVDIFFVISGYLISSIIFESLDKKAFSFSEFYARRIRRIFPALLLVLIACLAFGWVTLWADEYKQLGKHVMGGVGFVSNFVLWGEAGYFDNSAETKVLLHLWSLGIEEQFYIVWPVLLWVAWKCKFNLFAITVVCAILSFALNIKGAGQNAITTFYSPQTRFWELLCGSLLAWFFLYGKDVCRKWAVALHGWRTIAVHYQKIKPRDGFLLNVSSLLGLLLLAYGFWRIDKNMNFPGVWAVVPVLGTMLTISAGPSAWINRKILSNRIAVWLGLISFPLYLWHWPLLSFARIVEGEVPSRDVRIAAVALSVVLAWLTYRLVEHPVRLGRRSPWKVVALVALMVTVGGAGYIVYDSDGVKSRSHVVKMNSINAQFVGPLWKFAKNDLCESKYPFADTEKYGWWFCMANSPEKPTLLLLGSSFANHLYPGFALNDEFKHHSVLSIGTCDAGWVERSDPTTELTSLPCSGQRRFDQQEFINHLVVKENSIRYVVIGGVRHNTDPGYLERLRKRINFLEKNNIKVIIFNPHVRLKYDIKGCYARPLKENEKTCQVPVGDYAEVAKNFNQLMETLLETNPNVLVFDQNTVFCDARVCHFKLPVMPAFRDEYSHYSEFASRLVIEEFARWAKIHAPDMLAP